MMSVHTREITEEEKTSAKKAAEEAFVARWGEARRIKGRYIDFKTVLNDITVESFHFGGDFVYRIAGEREWLHRTIQYERFHRGVGEDYKSESPCEGHLVFVGGDYFFILKDGRVCSYIRLE